MNLSPEEQQKVQDDAADVFEKFAKDMRAGRIRVTHMESQVEDDWAWSDQYMQSVPEPRFFKYTIKVEMMPEDEWDVEVLG